MLQSTTLQVILAVAAATVLLFALPVSLRDNVFRIIWAVRHIPSGLLKFLGWLVRQLMRLEHLKNFLLDPLCRFYYQRLGLTPNRQTWLRGFFLGWSLGALVRGHPAWAFGLYVFGWHFDMTDGRTAMLFPASRTKHGALWDPVIDIPFMIAFTFALADRFTWPLVAQVFGWMSVVRVIGFVGMTIRNWRQLSRGLGEWVLPTTPDGRMKSVVVFVAISVSMANWDNRWHLVWPDYLVIVAGLMEIRALQLLYRAWRHRQRPTVAADSTVPEEQIAP